MPSKPRLLVISQVYVPDPASVGQHMADAAEAMAARGFDVTVLTSARGYENPREAYPYREHRAGVDIVRLRWSSFGKRSIAHRLLGQGLFLLQVLVRGLFTRQLTGILVSTSPPMASFAAVVISFVRRVPLVYWLMDLNPDQVIALGKVSPGNPLVWAIRWLNRWVFSRAAAVVVLDRFMADRVRRQYKLRGRLEIMPPWPHEDSLATVDRANNPFVSEHKLADSFVVMYSGNHSLASPVTTLVEAALRMRDEQRCVFAFIGGGLGKRDVDAAIRSHHPANVLSLPYQPLARIKYSLSAADVHVVTLGKEMAGIIHPCKIYGAMAVGRPVLLIGPRPSHAADLIDRHQIGWQVDHGDIDGAVALLRRISSLPPETLAEMGERAHAAVREEFSKHALCEAFCDVLESAIMPAASADAASAGLTAERPVPARAVVARSHVDAAASD